MTIRLYDGLGQTVQNLLTAEYRGAGANREQFRLAPQLPAGPYVLSVSNGHKQFTINVIKQ